MARRGATKAIKMHGHGSALVAELVPYERNARTHSDEQVASIVRSMREFGFTNPLLVDERKNVIAGHGRLEAAKLLGLESVPVVTVSGLSEAQRRALVLADNKLALDAEWDLDLLKAELLELREFDFDLAVAGFTEGEVLDLLGGSSTEADPDAAPPPPDRSFSRPGDVWVLGPHRVVCGDSCSPVALSALLGKEKCDVCWTDPPYNVDYQGSAGKIEGDNQSGDAFLAMLRGMLGGAFDALKKGAPIYVAHADTEGVSFRQAFQEAGFKLSGVVIWMKDSLVLGRSDYQWQHEPILYGWKPGSAHRWYGGRKRTTMVKLADSEPFARNPDGSWTVRVGDRSMVIRGEFDVEEVVPSVMHEAKPSRNDVHPTMKPVALVERMLTNSARPGDLVLDVCGGSGSTLIAAERLGMCARLVELDPRFVDVIVSRWQTYTGRRAVREGDGAEFPEA